MSTFNKVFCQGIYEKGVVLDATTLKGLPGIVKITEGVSNKGDTGENGRLKVFTITTGPNDAIIKVQSAVDAPYDVLHIVKVLEDSPFDCFIMDHLDVQICKFYKAHKQEVMLYKRATEWVL